MKEALKNFNIFTLHNPCVEITILRETFLTQSRRLTDAVLTTLNNIRQSCPFLTARFSFSWHASIFYTPLLQLPLPYITHSSSSSAELQILLSYVSPSLCASLREISTNITHRVSVWYCLCESIMTPLFCRRQRRVREQRVVIIRLVNQSVIQSLNKMARTRLTNNYCVCLNPDYSTKMFYAIRSRSWRLCLWVIDWSTESNASLKNEKPWLIVYKPSIATVHRGLYIYMW